MNWPTFLFGLGMTGAVATAIIGGVILDAEGDVSGSHVRLFWLGLALSGLLLSIAWGLG